MIVWTDWSTSRVQVGLIAVADARIEELIAATPESAPRDATHWSTRSMASHLGLSQSTVAWIKTWNENPRRCVWGKTAD